MEISPAGSSRALGALPSKQGFAENTDVEIIVQIIKCPTKVFVVSTTFQIVCTLLLHKNPAVRIDRITTRHIRGLRNIEES